MKVSEITIDDVINYINEDKDECDKKLIQNILQSAISYVSNYTGIPQNGGDETLDDYDDLWLPVMVLCQDMYDNRSMYVEKRNVNKSVASVLDMHRHNLV